MPSLPCLVRSGRYVWTLVTPQQLSPIAIATRPSASSGHCILHQQQCQGFNHCPQHGRKYAKLAEEPRVESTASQLCQLGGFTSQSASHSNKLIQAVRDEGFSAPPPTVTLHKLNLSHVSHRAIRQSPRRSVAPRTPAASFRRLRQTPSNGDPKPSLQAILADYIRHANPALPAIPSDEAMQTSRQHQSVELATVVDGRSEAFLEEKGYTSRDLFQWAEIATTNSSEQAMIRLMTLSNAVELNTSPTQSRVPLFLFMFVLGRTDLNTQSLRLAITYAWDRINRRHNATWHLPDLTEFQNQTPPQSMLVKRVDAMTKDPHYYPPLSEPTITIIIVRLLRQARLVWPAALVSIVGLLSALKALLRNGQYQAKTSARLSHLYNRVLSLVALPCSIDPMRSIPYQQQAQFNILREMNDFKPPLAINREGYRAVAQVQLAHRKTTSEADWAQRKAKSWPPWKEDKLGIDMDKGIEFGISRAQEVLKRAKEAGYGPLEWEKTATVLSGWDLDRSPTIQTRSIINRHPRTRFAKRPQSNLSQKPLDGLITESVWAARVRSTRSIDEAWAGFLAYKDQIQPQSSEVYHAMFEKVVFEAKRQRGLRRPSLSQDQVRDDGGCSLFPGDGKEVAATPTNPQDAVYVRTKAPDISGLLRYMVADGIRPDGRFLAFLLMNCSSFGMGMMILHKSHLSEHVIKVLLRRHPEKHEIKPILESVPKEIFAAYIHLLTRFRIGTIVEDFDDKNILGGATKAKKQGHSLDNSNATMQAYTYLLLVKPRYRPSWYTLLSAMARQTLSRKPRHPGPTSTTSDMEPWLSMMKLVEEMQAMKLDLDFKGFQILCQGLERAIKASQRVLAAIHQPVNTISPPPASPTVNICHFYKADAEWILQTGPLHLIAIFRQITGQNPAPHTWNRANDASPFGNRPHSIQPSSGIPSASALPPLNEIPTPAHLHAFIRVLGLARDNTALLHLVQWMVDFAAELYSVAAEMAGGSRLGRRCIVAIRVYVERQPWGEGVGACRSGVYAGRESVGGLGDVVHLSDVLQDGKSRLEMGMGREMEVVEMENKTQPPVQETRDEIQRLVESVPDWGGWPTDGEVETYLRVGRERPGD